MPQVPGHTLNAGSTAAATASTASEELAQAVGDLDLDSTETAGRPTESDARASSSATPETLASVAERLMKMAEADRADPSLERVDIEASSDGDVGLPFRFDIWDTFNSSNTYWLAAVEDIAEDGLTDEVELNDLLGMDEPTAYEHAHDV